MLLAFGYLYEFLMFYFLFFSESRKEQITKKLVAQNFEILFFCCYLE